MILKGTIHYYSTLFTKDTPSPKEEENITLECIPLLVSNEINDSLNKHITLDELEGIVLQMKKGKAPRPDVFSIEFHHEFWDIVKLNLLKWF